MFIKLSGGVHFNTSLGSQSACVSHTRRQAFTPPLSQKHSSLNFRSGADSFPVIAGQLRSTTHFPQPNPEHGFVGSDGLAHTIPSLAQSLSLLHTLFKHDGTGVGVAVGVAVGLRHDPLRHTFVPSQHLVWGQPYSPAPRHTTEVGIGGKQKP